MLQKAKGAVSPTKGRLEKNNANFTPAMEG
jgi:hypothetical protein